MIPLAHTDARHDLVVAAGLLESLLLGTSGDERIGVVGGDELGLERVLKEAKGQRRGAWRQGARQRLTDRRPRSEAKNTHSVEPDVVRVTENIEMTKRGYDQLRNARRWEG